METKKIKNSYILVFDEYKRSFAKSNIKMSVFRKTFVELLNNLGYVPLNVKVYKHNLKFGDAVWCAEAACAKTTLHRAMEIGEIKNTSKSIKISKE